MWILRCKKKAALKSATSENCGFFHAGESAVENPLQTHNVWTYPEFDMVSGTYCACLWSGHITKSATPNVMLTNFYLWQGIFIFKYPVGLFFFFYNAHVILCKITYYFFMLYVIWNEVSLNTADQMHMELTGYLCTSLRFPLVSSLVCTFFFKHCLSYSKTF